MIGFPRSYQLIRQKFADSCANDSERMDRESNIDLDTHTQICRCTRVFAYIRGYQSLALI